MIATVANDPQAANLNVRMPLQLRQELQDVADELGVRVSVVARYALERGLRSAHTAIQKAIDAETDRRLADAVRERDG